ncbi:endonuclease/exonuclease/phosphatase family protein [Streptomyces sp. A7024]|uniref:Endonuclease/exonuclease/phosphatase family protein n=1 Tax=Streptomyces coryli TaxID=1128680 RepID=A0A6G4TSZ6_9ACTN|nr:endonuclease/exonuclease/phosphatase family protein [Streptomyces coryli]NGN62984.1 endonuclease/exonuclease/phosphatase family protein [Streptomyces coryli]
MAERSAPLVTRRRLLGAAAAGALAPHLGPAASLAQAAARVPAGGAPPLATGPALRTLSFNVRYASDEIPHSWAERRPLLSALLCTHAPHLIGTQEGKFHQLRDIQTDLGPCYDWIGTGSEGGSRGEYMAVFYDTRRLDPRDYGHYWLSDTPDRIASNTWGNDNIRMVTWVRFADRITGRRFYAVNTHLDHISQPSRERSAALIARRLRQFRPQLPCIVTGDFNAAAHANPAYETLLRSAGLTDTWDTAESRGTLYGTYHGWRPLTPDGDRIDWILTSPTVRTTATHLLTTAQAASDHLPVAADLVL